MRPPHRGPHRLNLVPEMLPAQPGDCRLHPGRRRGPGRLIMARQPGDSGSTFLVSALVTIGRSEASELGDNEVMRVALDLWHTR